MNTFSTFILLIIALAYINIVESNLQNCSFDNTLYKVIHSYNHFKHLIFLSCNKFAWKSSDANTKRIDTGQVQESIQRRNLQRTTLKVCIVITNDDTLNHLTDKRDRHIDSITKVDYVLVKHLGDFVNATLEFSIQDTWGYKNNQSEWNGMIGELISGRADIGGTALFFTADRVELIDYIAMVTPTKSKFIFRQPKLSYVTNVFILPFDDVVWMSCFSLLLIISFVLYLVTRWEWKARHICPETTSSNEIIRPNYIDAAFLSLCALCQQGSSQIPHSSGGRIVAFISFLSFMFLYTSYSANIVALLQSSSERIQTLDDILHSKLEVGVDDTVFNHFYFKNATEKVRRAIYLQKVAPPGKRPRFFSIEEGIKKMRNELFAFHVETGPGYKFISETFQEYEKCGLKEIPYLQVPDPWLAIQKNSPYKKILKIGLRLIHESGIQNREVNLIYTRKPSCLSGGNSFISVGFTDCYFAIMVFAIGTAISLILCCVEIIIHKICHQ